MKRRFLLLFVVWTSVVFVGTIWVRVHNSRVGRAPAFPLVQLQRRTIQETVFEPSGAIRSAPVTPATARPPKEHAGKHPELCQVTHQPVQPKGGEVVHVSVQTAEPFSALLLEYQVVDPGKYIALKDPAFEKQWTGVPMSLSVAPNAAPGTRTFLADLPGSLQKHRRLVRYRIRNVSDKKRVAPEADDPQPNFAYFVYDGVPAWQGAIDPNASDRKVRQAVTFSHEALERTPVYHLIGSKTAIQKATFGGSDEFGDGNRNAYHYTGTLVYDGIVYDHVGFRARGGVWRHAMGKNMWKFNFLPGHRFAARDDYGRPYESKWDKLNLGACIQQGDYGMRGEQGMFEAVGFRLFNLAGTEGPRTHWVHFRIIDAADEATADQYEGDFWGLYLAVENIDGHFVKEHHLPSGNVYKMEFQPKTAFQGDPTVTDQRDIVAFLNGLQRRPQNDAWWTEQVDLNRYYAYRAIVECIHHYDLDASKNYFFYRNPENRKWTVLPWDIDLTWGDQMFGGGHEPFYRAGILFRAPFKQQYQERLAEIRDLLFNPEQTGRLIDEHAAMIWDPSGKPSLVDADRARWDYCPALESRGAMSMKGGKGRFYFGNPRNTFPTMVTYMKSYVDKRVHWIDRSLLGDYRPPSAPRLGKPDHLDLAQENVSFRVESKPDEPLQNYQWRLAEIADPASPSFNPREPWKYEIQSIWEQSVKNSATVAVPTKLLAAGHTYRVRARWQSSDGSWSRWSAPVELAVK